MGVPENMKTEEPCDPAIPLLALYSKALGSLQQEIPDRHVYYGIVHRSQDLEFTDTFMDR